MGPPGRLASLSELEFLILIFSRKLAPQVAKLKTAHFIKVNYSMIKTLMNCLGWWAAAKLNPDQD